MGTGYHGGFGATFGNKHSGLLRMNLQLFASKAFALDGHLSEESFEAHREFFLGKSIKKIEKEMNKHGYKTHIEPSKHKTSKAKKIIVDNPSKSKNISSVQVSPGSKRHGDTPYVKISTTDNGRLKIVSKEAKYKSDGNENSKVFFPRRKQQ